MTTVAFAVARSANSPSGSTASLLNPVKVTLPRVPRVLLLLLLLLTFPPPSFLFLLLETCTRA